MGDVRSSSITLHEYTHAPLPQQDQQGQDTHYEEEFKDMSHLHIGIQTGIVDHEATLRTYLSQMLYKGMDEKITLVPTL